MGMLGSSTLAILPKSPTASQLRLDYVAAQDRLSESQSVYEEDSSDPSAASEITTALWEHANRIMLRGPLRTNEPAPAGVRY